MAKKFDIPEFYKSDIIRSIKNARQILDPRKKNIEPVTVDFGPVQFYVPRHFGFCYGVENAIDIAYRTIEQNPDKKIYLLSEMIHNPNVNEDLQRRGVQFLFETDGTVLIPISSLGPDDIVIVPAFGTTIEIQKELEQQGINPYQFDTTCPFVEKVWKRGNQLGKKENALVIHGKHNHEETRATFSHSAKSSSAVVVVLNPQEAHILADIMLGKRSAEEFETHFGHKATPGFDPVTDLQKFGVINQTTMLATETQEVMRILKDAVAEKYGADNVKQHFADTSDTLCYATNENQSATNSLMHTQADLAVVVGGYNSSNTMHLVELLEQKFPTFHVRDAGGMKSREEIHHFNQWDKTEHVSLGWLPGQTSKPIKIAITSGASCPDILVDEVILKLLGWFDETYRVDDVLKPFRETMADPA